MDLIFRNVFSLSKPKSFDLGSCSKGDTRTVTFPMAGMVSVYCHLHPNLTATILTARPIAGLRRRMLRAARRLRDVPPGTYTLVARHRAAGYLCRQVVVDGVHDVQANLVLPLVVLLVSGPHGQQGEGDRARGPHHLRGRRV